jgi:lysophospholipase L1-like esterase
VKQAMVATAIAWAVLAAAGIGAAVGLTGCGSSGSSSASASAASASASSAASVEVAAARGGLSACEQRLERTRRADQDRVPVVAILGASYTAGVGPGAADRSWAVLLVRHLRWDAVIDGVSGAGYVRPGSGDRGPLVRMLSRIRLAVLDPSLVVIQLGHDDMGVPPATERRAVAHAITLIRSADPAARIALVTVFTTRGGDTAGARRTDSAIVSGAESADRGVIIMDPLTGHWNYPHADGGAGLHPTAAGDAWIAREVASVLAHHDVRRATDSPGPVVCDSGIPHRTV